MRHGVKTSKLQRNASHRRALLANQACSLILNGRITTTLAKAKALRPYVEKLITLAKRGDVHSRRLATATIHNTVAVKRLFDEIAPLCAERKGGYTRIVKLGQRLPGMRGTHSVVPEYSGAKLAGAPGKIRLLRNAHQLPLLLRGAAYGPAFRRPGVEVRGRLRGSRHTALPVDCHGHRHHVH